MMMVPITVFIFVAGEWCVALIYGHGTFTQTAVIDTTQALWGYSVGLIPMSLILVLAPAFYARGNYKTPSIAATASMAMNIALNFAMVGIFELGPTSIAVATSISAWFNLAWLYWAIKKT